MAALQRLDRKITPFPGMGNDAAAPRFPVGCLRLPDFLGQHNARNPFGGRRGAVATPG